MLCYISRWFPPSRFESCLALTWQKSGWRLKISHALAWIFYMEDKCQWAVARGHWPRWIESGPGWKASSSFLSNSLSLVPQWRPWVPWSACQEVCGVVKSSGCELDARILWLSLLQWCECLLGERWGNAACAGAQMPTPQRGKFTLWRAQKMTLLTATPSSCFCFHGVCIFGLAGCFNSSKSMLKMHGLKHSFSWRRKVSLDAKSEVRNLGWRIWSFWALLLSSCMAAPFSQAQQSSMHSGHQSSKDWILWTAGMNQLWASTCWITCFRRMMMERFPAQYGLVPPGFTTYSPNSWRTLKGLVQPRWGWLPKEERISLVPPFQFLTGLGVWSRLLFWWKFAVRSLQDPTPASTMTCIKRFRRRGLLFTAALQSNMTESMKWTSEMKRRSRASVSVWI